MTTSNTRVTHLLVSRKWEHVRNLLIVVTLDRIIGKNEYNNRANQSVLKTHQY